METQEEGGYLHTKKRAPGETSPTDSLIAGLGLPERGENKRLLLRLSPWSVVAALGCWVHGAIPALSPRTLVLGATPALSQRMLAQETISTHLSTLRRPCRTPLWPQPRLGQAWICPPWIFPELFPRTLAAESPYAGVRLPLLGSVSGPPRSSCPPDPPASTPLPLPRMPSLLTPECALSVPRTPSLPPAPEAPRNGLRLSTASFTVTMSFPDRQGAGVLG